MDDKRLADLRRNYDRAHLDETTVSKDPIVQFESWLAAAMEQKLEVEPNAMVLSTSDAAGNPAGRVVLLKGIIDGSFVFFTNYESDKGVELAQNPNCALTFWWQHAQRQVRISGTAEKIDRKSSEDYFTSRPLGSQLGALISPQSRIIESREDIERAYHNIEQTYHDDAKPKMPEHWGGYKVIPHTMEFWQGRTNRLHDRLRYRLLRNKWCIERLAP